MRIEVASCDWGDAIVDNIQALLLDVASHMTRLLRDPMIASILVHPTPTTDHDPMTLYRSSTHEPFIILIQARDRHWAKFAYQFSHEFCHVLSEYERLKDNPNNWFHEALCELASVFTLRRMAERWPTFPPYPNWIGYAESLANYAQGRLSRKEHQLPASTTLSDWLLSEESNLRRDSVQRDKNAIVAYALLPLFEREPNGWNAVRSLPATNGTLAQYLADWYGRVHATEKPFVRQIMDILGPAR